METSFQLPKVGQLIQEAWQIYTAKFRTLLVLTLPFLIWSIVNVNLNMTHNVTYIIVGGLLSFIVAVFTQAALFGNFTKNGSFSLALETFPKYLWTGILAGLIVTTGMFLFIIPGIIWIFWFALSIPIIADERSSGMQPLLKSREYMRGRTLQVIGRVAAFGLITVIPSLILSFFTKYQPMMPYVQSIYITLILPISSAYLYNLYQHIKSTRPVVNPSSSGTGFKVAAWIGILLTVGLAIVGILFAKVYLPKLQHLIDLRNTHYTISPADVSNIPGGQQLSDYVIAELKRGVSESDIRSSLAKAGWQQQYVDQVFQAIKIQK